MTKNVLADNPKLVHMGVGQGTKTEQKHCEAKAQNWHHMTSTTFCGLQQAIWRAQIQEVTDIDSTSWWEQL